MQPREAALLPVEEEPEFRIETRIEQLYQGNRKKIIYKEV